MNSRGCALVILVLLLAVLAWGLTSVFGGTPIKMPAIGWPNLGQNTTLTPFEINLPVMVGGEGEGTAQAGSQPGTAALNAPTPEPERNGRLLILGFDASIWSVDVELKSAVVLGQMMELHIYSGNPWFSPDGKFAFVARTENDQKVGFLVHTDGSLPDLRLGLLTPEFDFGSPRDFFGFSPDSRGFFFVDASTNPASLIVAKLDTETLTSFAWPIQASPEEITFAAYIANGDNLLVKSYDPNTSSHYLELFQVGDTLTAPRRVFSRDGYEIIQFIVSPDLSRIAIVSRKFGVDQADELSVFHLETGELTQVPLDGPGRVVMTSPAWSPNGGFVLFNSWSVQGENLVYSYNSFDVTKKVSLPLFDKVNSEKVGQPLSRVFSFAPDGLGAGVRLYEDLPGHVSALLVLLDGSYHIEIARAFTENGVRNGSYVAGFSTDWTRSVVVEPKEGGKLGDLYAGALDGSKKELLDSPVPYEFFDIGPVISPDGKSVAYLLLDIATQQASLAVINLDGSDRRIILDKNTLIDNKVLSGLPLVWLPASGR